jgi:hypothetical protein
LHYVAVVSYRSWKHGKRQRRYSGIEGLLRATDTTFDELDEDVRAHVQHEKDRDIEERDMGKSIFHMHGGVFRTVCREGLVALGMRALDVDLQSCYLSLRYHHFADKDSCPVLRQLVEDPDAFYERLVKLSGLLRGDVKQHIIAVANGGGVKHEKHEYVAVLLNL